MDKKSLLGLFIIGVILFVFTWHSSKQQAEIARQQASIDSAARASLPVETVASEIDPASPSPTADSAALREKQQREEHLGRYLYAATEGTETFYTIENDLLKIRFSNKGGRVASVELKDYKTYRQTPLLLFADSTSVFDLSFFIKKGYNTQINTSEYYFEPVDANGLAFAPGEEQKNSPCG